MRFLYDICFLIFALFYLPFFLMKGKHKQGFLTRLGLVPRPIRESLAGEKVIWVHAVSVGEMVQAIRLVNALREKLREFKFVLTATTATGLEVAQKLKNDEDTALYFPVDFRICVSSFIRGISPQAVVILETEIWPNVIYELSRRKIPVYIVNGRISDKAIDSYRRVRHFLRPVLNRLSGISVQDDLMKARFLDLGADARLVSVTGNMKFDWRPAPQSGEAVENLKRALKPSDSFLCIAGSTHEGEEEILFEMYSSVRRLFPSFRLLIAPRHPDRIEAIEARALRKGVDVKRVSRIAASGVVPEHAVLLLDTMGLLSSLYRLADVVFVGGSLVPSGGHNIVEPAFFERAIIFGPHMQNFREMAEAFKKANAAIEVKDRGELEKALVSLLKDSKTRGALGLAAKSLVLRHQGATERNTQELLSAFKIN